MNARFFVVEGSRSGHCCFEWTVIDSTKEGEDAQVCECFEEASAQVVAAALNVATASAAQQAEQGGE